MADSSTVFCVCNAKPVMQSTWSLLAANAEGSAPAAAHVAWRNVPPCWWIQSLCCSRPTIILVRYRVCALRAYHCRGNLAIANILLKALVANIRLFIKSCTATIAKITTPESIANSNTRVRAVIISDKEVTASNHPGLC